MNLLKTRRLSTRVWRAHQIGNHKHVLQLEETELAARSCAIAAFDTNLTLKVNAVSLNPIDHWVINGRGANVRETYRKLFQTSTMGSTDTIIPGRDFHATVVASNGSYFGEGAQVIGVRHPFDSGALSEYISVPESTVCLANPNLTPEENAALPFAACTILSSLGLHGGMSLFGPAPVSRLEDLAKRRCLVIGATGGIGSILVQILEHNGAQLIDGIGSSLADMNQLPLRKRLSYKDPDFKEKLTENDYDFIFDAADGKAHEWVGEYMNYAESYLISYSSPLLELIGSASILSLPEFALCHRRVEESLREAAGSGAHFRFGFFCEKEKYFDEIKKFNFKPKISKVFPFENVNEALESLTSEKHFGKVVVKL